MTKIAASILSADFANLKHDCTRLLEAGVDLMHVDVMDGPTSSATARRC